MSADFDRRLAHIPDAARIMADATAYFVLENYAVEGLTALVEAGWDIRPPGDARRFRSALYRAAKATPSQFVILNGDGDLAAVDELWDGDDVLAGPTVTDCRLCGGKPRWSGGFAVPGHRTGCEGLKR